MKKCPFCKSQGILIPWESGDNNPKEKLFQPGCFQGIHKMDFVGTKEECLDLWNNRNHF